MLKDEEEEKVKEEKHSKSCSKHITELSEEEREKVLGKDEKARASYERCMKEGLYHCKRDRCKEMREKREKEEKEREEALCCLREREKIWEADAKQKEEEFAAYKEMTDRRLEQIVGLVKGLLDEKAASQAAPPVLKRTKTVKP